MVEVSMNSFGLAHRGIRRCTVSITWYSCLVSHSQPYRHLLQRFYCLASFFLVAVCLFFGLSAAYTAALDSRNVSSPKSTDKRDQTR